MQQPFARKKKSLYLAQTFRQIISTDVQIYVNKSKFCQSYSFHHKLHHER